MFEDSYRREMNDLQASESLITDTVKKMQDEQARSQSQQSDNSQGDSETPLITALPDIKARKAKKRNLVFLRVGLPAIAACTVLVLLGAMIFPQLLGESGQNNSQDFLFQLVNGNSSIHGDLKFGSVDHQQNGVELHMKQAECTEALLPEDILKAKPATIGSYKVYLGYDEQQATCYAAYRKDSSGDKWTLLQSTDLDKTAFVEELRLYFAFQK